MLHGVKGFLDNKSVLKPYSFCLLILCSGTEGRSNNNQGPNLNIDMAIREM